MEKDGLCAQEDASKQGRMIDQNAEIALDDETQGRINDDEMFGVDDLDGEEVIMETKTGVKDSAALAIDVTKDEDKGKAKMIKPEVPIKRKEQIRINEELLAKNLQAREREEFSEVQKARLLVELIEKRKKHFAALRAQEKRNKPPTKTQMKSQMSTYLKHMGGYKQSYLKGRSFDEIKKLFNREMTKVNDFIAMDSEAQESSTKRTAKHLESDISKKLKVDENVKPAIDDSEELRNLYENVSISHETSVARISQQNGVVERRNCTLVEAALTIRPDLSYLHIFSALSYPNNDSEDLGKLKAKANVGIFIGYAPKKKAYNIYNLRTQKIIETIHVAFDGLTTMASEQLSSGPGLQLMTLAISSSRLVTNLIPQQPFLVANAPRAVDLVDSPVSTITKMPYFHDDPLHESFHEDSTSQGASSNVRPIHTPFESLEPKNFKQGMNEPSWIDAMQEEIQEFERLQVWELVPGLDKVMLLTLKWIYNVKTDEFGEVLKNKARLVA
nr:hypothetical protein [Tanacetum cinerariifolium]